MSILKAKVDKDTCIGCELCTQICPEVFEMNDEQIAIVIADPVPTAVEGTAKEAEEQCPVGAITVE